jgi:hypothetical protein
VYPWVIGAEWPLTAELEAIIRDGIRDGELRADLPADLLALAVAGLTDLALVQHWVPLAPGPPWRRCPPACSPCSSDPAREAARDPRPSPPSAVMSCGPARCAAAVTRRIARVGDPRAAHAAIRARSEAHAAAASA